MQRCIENLSWNVSKDLQQKTMQNIISNKKFPYKNLLQPNGRKDCWENCANILICLDDDNLIDLLPGLLEWLQDLNWPGAKIILERLKKMPIEKINIALREAKKEAIQTNDQEWMENLEEL